MTRRVLEDEAMTRRAFLAICAVRQDRDQRRGPTRAR